MHHFLLNAVSAEGTRFPPGAYIMPFYEYPRYKLSLGDYTITLIKREGDESQIGGLCYNQGPGRRWSTAAYPADYPYGLGLQYRHADAERHARAANYRIYEQKESLIF